MDRPRAVSFVPAASSIGPLQHRVTRFTLAAVAAALIVTSLTGWVALRATLFNISERGSLAIARDLGPLVRHDLSTDATLDEPTLGSGNTVVEVVGADGTVLALPSEQVHLVLGQDEAHAARQQTPLVRNTTADDGQTYRLVALPLGDEARNVLVVARPLTASYEVLRVFGLVMLLGGGIGMAIAAAFGRPFARAAIRPVQRLTDAVRHVAETDDLTPLPVASRSGDVADLTDAFNELLSRLARSRRQQDQLISDAGHELKTPLTSIRTNLELLALDTTAHRLRPEHQRQILNDVHHETVKLSSLIADIVYLRRSPITTPADIFDLTELVERSTARAQQLHPTLNIDVRTEPATLRGQPASLQRAIDNVLDNACRWSPPHATILVQLAGGRLTVTDQGPGIAPAHAPHVFDPFYRADQARASDGAGLGLSIAAKIVREHRGTIRAEESPEGGTRIVIELTARHAFQPAAPPPAAPRPTADDQELFKVDGRQRSDAA